MNRSQSAIAESLDLRWFGPRDIPECVRMESFTEDPWHHDDLAEVNDSKDINGIVASDRHSKEARHGYLLYQYRKTALRIVRVCVQPYLRRCGVGRARFTHLIADVPEECLSGQLLLRSCGMRCEYQIIKPSGAEYRFISWK